MRSGSRSAPASHAVRVPRVGPVLRHAIEAAAGHQGGEPTRDIPALAVADPEAAGIAFAAWGTAAGTETTCAGSGRWLQPFSLQSISKVFAFALLLAAERDDAWGPFSLAGNENHRSTAPLDRPTVVAPGPFTNAGALLVVDRLMRHHDDVAASVVDLITAETVGHEPSATTQVEEGVAASELAAGHRNHALVHLLAEHRLLHHRVADVLEQYVRVCAVSATCRAVCLAGGILARDGVRRDGRPLIEQRHARRLNALMLTSGAYADSGRYAVQVGLPLKSGIGGGVLAVVPRRAAICAWSPGVDASGMSRRGLAAIAYVAADLDLSLF